MRLSVIVCTHDRYSFLPRALESLIPQQHAGDIDEIIVVDNSPDAAKAASFAKDYESVGSIKFHYSPVVGLSNARNIGLRETTGEVVAFLDDDAVASPSWARALLDVFVAHGPSTGAVGGPVRPIWIEPPPRWMTERFHDILALVDLGDAVRALEPGEWLAGCNIAFSRDAILDVGGFDVGLGRIGSSLLSNEETIVSEKIRTLGRKIMYAPKAAVDHVIPPSRLTVEYVTRRVAWQAISDVMARPVESAALAQSNARHWSKTGRLLKALRFFRLSSRSNASFSSRDYDFIYELVNQLLCFERR